MVDQAGQVLVNRNVVNGVHNVLSVIGEYPVRTPYISKGFPADVERAEGLSSTSSATNNFTLRIIIWIADKDTGQRPLAIWLPSLQVVFLWASETLAGTSTGCPTSLR